MKIKTFLNDRQKLLVTEMLLAAAIVFSAPKLWAAQGKNNIEPGELFVLSSTTSTPNPEKHFLPALQYLGTETVNGKEKVKTKMYDKVYFAPGTQFTAVQWNHSNIHLYGDSLLNMDSYTPILFVKPLNEYGEILDITLGFPAQYMISSIKNKTAYQRNQSILDEEYKKLNKNFKTESTKLVAYESFLISNPDDNINVFKGYFDQPSAALKDVVYSTVSSAVDEVANSAQASARPSQGPTTVVSRTDVSATSRPVPSSKTNEPKRRASNPAPGSRQERPASSSKDKSFKASDNVSSKVLNYNEDARFRGFVEVRTNENIEKNALIYVTTDSGKKVLNYTALSSGERFIPVPTKPDSHRNKETNLLYRAFYKVNNQQDVTSDDDGTPILFYLPLQALEYVNTKTGNVESVTKDTNLTPKPTLKPAPTRSFVASSTNAQSEGTDAGTDTSKPNSERTKTPGLKTPQAKPRATPKPVPPQPKKEVASNPVPKAQKAKSSGVKASFSECQNPGFLQQLSDSGENCQLIEIEDFKLVKSELVNQLKDHSNENSILLNSSVIAIDNDSKICSKMSVSYDEYLDDAKAQEKINSYKKSMGIAFKEIQISILNNPGMLGEAIQGNQEPGKYTYSCINDQESCRFSQDILKTEELSLLQEVTNYGDLPESRQSVKVYGPTEEDKKYLILLQKGGKTTKSFVVQDNSFIFFRGNVGEVYKSMKAFEKKFKFKKLSEIQAHYNSPKLRESKNGFFINSETVYTNDRERKQTARLGTPDAEALINKLTNTQSFYELKCISKPLVRAEALPKWVDDGNSDTRGQATE